jgi:hypothetical protein
MTIQYFHDAINQDGDWGQRPGDTKMIVWDHPKLPGQWSVCFSRGDNVWSDPRLLTTDSPDAEWAYEAMVKNYDLEELRNLYPLSRILSMSRDEVFDSIQMYHFSQIKWDIRREGRAWQGEEAIARYELTPEKFEMSRGKLFWDDAQRLTMLGLMLENVGIDRAIRMGDPNVWREAIAQLDETEER